MRWFASGGSRADPVYVLQEALAEPAHLSLDTMLDALDATVQEQLWQAGRQFDCFAEFAVGLRPAGLGVRSLPPLKLLRYALLANGYFAHWTELLERVARNPAVRAKNSSMTRVSSASTPSPLPLRLAIACCWR